MKRNKKSNKELNRYQERITLLEKENYELKLELENRTGKALEWRGPIAAIKLNERNDQ